ncbi:MAG: hypothetical protein ABSF52_08880 [Syntrophobacteraceae bacterium]|jgi:hypothetical protein
MPEAILDDKVISLRSFESLYDQYIGFCRQLRFLVKSALVMEEESLALEIIIEFLDRKEKDLEELKAATQGQIKGRNPESEPVELLLGRLLMQHEDYPILRRITEIKRNGGTKWQALQAIIQEQAVIKDASPPDGGSE